MTPDRPASPQTPPALMECPMCGGEGRIYNITDAIEQAQADGLVLVPVPPAPPLEEERRRQLDLEAATNTTGWLLCPRTGCGWRMDPEFPECPVHGAVAHD